MNARIMNMIVSKQLEIALKDFATEEEELEHPGICSRILHDVPSA